MQTGQIISGIGHVVLIGWAMVGSVVFKPTPPPSIELTEVTLVTAEELAGFAASAPQVSTQAPEAPAPREAAEEAPSPRPQPDQLAVLQPPAPQVPDAPEVPDTPAAPPPPQAPRIAPLPAPPTEDPARPDPVTAPATTPLPAEPDAQPAVEPQPEATAPAEATTAIAPDPGQELSLAPTASQRPKTRPARPTPPAVETADTPPPEAPTNDPLADAVADAVADALANPTPTPAPLGPPLTSGERDALRVAVAQCWNIGSLSSEAQRVVVTIAMEMTRAGTPIIESVRMIGYEGGSDAAARQAFETARRAIIRCGNSGFNLPDEKFDQWQQIEMTFNPEEMRLR